MHRRRDGRGIQTADKDDAEGRRKRALDAESEAHPHRGGDPLRRGQGGEGHDRQCGVGGWTGLDEGRGEGVDRVETERGTVWVRGGDLSQSVPLDGGVEGFRDEDGACDGKIILAGDETGAAEVGGCADAFEHRGEGYEGFGVGVREVVRAGGDWLGAGGGEGRGEERDVFFFVVSDVLEIVVVRAAEAGIYEFLF